MAIGKPQPLSGRKIKFSPLCRSTSKKTKDITSIFFSATRRNRSNSLTMNSLTNRKDNMNRIVRMEMTLKYLNKFLDKRLIFRGSVKLNRTASILGEALIEAYELGARDTKKSTKVDFKEILFKNLGVKI